MVSKSQDTAAVIAALGSNIQPEPIAKETAAAINARMLKDRVYIQLEEDDSIPPNGIFIGYNGASFILKPNMVASVPRGLLGILDAAIIQIPIKDPVTLRFAGVRPKRRFNYRIVRPEELAA